MEETTINPIIELKQEAFQSFIDDAKNSELVASGKYGIHEYVDGEWVTKEIDQADYINYNHHPLSEDFIVSEKYIQLNADYHAYPFVVLK